MGATFLLMEIGILFGLAAGALIYYFSHYENEDFFNDNHHFELPHCMNQSCQQAQKSPPLHHFEHISNTDIYKKETEYYAILQTLIKSIHFLYFKLIIIPSIVLYHFLLLFLPIFLFFLIVFLWSLLIFGKSYHCCRIRGVKLSLGYHWEDITTILLWLWFFCLPFVDLSWFPFRDYPTFEL